MTMEFSQISLLSDEDLLTTVTHVAAHERSTTADLIALLMELDTRRLYLAEGCSSLFTYCTQVLRLSEHAAYGRIEAARAARRFPLVLDRLCDGSLNLTTCCLLAPHLTATNVSELLTAAAFKSRREVEQLVARLRPRPDVSSSVRKLPMPRQAVAAMAWDRNETSLLAHFPTLSDVACPPPATASMAPHTAAQVQPLAPARYKIQFTADRETYADLRRAQDLLRHAIPNGDLAAIFARALALLVRDLSRRKCAASDRPRRSRGIQSHSRHIPAAVKRAVVGRDGGRCAFLGNAGRCTETGFLEFHHVVPFADGGVATVDNIQLRCRAHNVYEAERWFGAGDP